MATRDVYTINADTPEELRSSLNFILQRISDRLDKLEGIRGKTAFVGESLETQGEIVVKDSNSEKIHSME